MHVGVARSLYFAGQLSAPDSLPPEGPAASFLTFLADHVAATAQGGRALALRNLACLSSDVQIRRSWKMSLRWKSWKRRRRCRLPRRQRQCVACTCGWKLGLMLRLQISIPAPDPALPPSFDSDSSAHHFRFLESASQWLVRPIVEAHGWDHEAGVDGLSVDKAFLLRKSIPANVRGQITKDKKDANLTLETEASVKHSEKVVTTSGLDVQTVGGRQLAYTLRSETRWKNRPTNKTAGGLSASYVGGVVALGAKVEDRWKVTPSSKLVLSCGAITAKGDTAYGACAACAGTWCGVAPGLLSDCSHAAGQVVISREACGTTRTRRCPGAPRSAARS